MFVFVRAAFKIEECVVPDGIKIGAQSHGAEVVAEDLRFPLVGGDTQRRRMPLRDKGEDQIRLADGGKPGDTERPAVFQTAREVFVRGASADRRGDKGHFCHSD